MRMLLHSPKDMLAGALAVAAVGAIIANALFLQAGRHPSPMFGSVVTLPAPAAAPPARCRVRARSKLTRVLPSRAPFEPKAGRDQERRDPKLADPSAEPSR